MKLVIDKFVYEAPGMAVIPETEYEAAMLLRYWPTATLSIGRANSEHNSADGRSYSIKFAEPENPTRPSALKGRERMSESKVIHCPACKSADVHFDGNADWTGPEWYTCQNCQHSFELTDPSHT